MSLFLKIVVYLVAGLVLLTIDVLFVRRVASEFTPREKPPVIASFRIIGRADADKIGEVMAQMLVARAHELNVEIDTAVKALKSGDAKKDGRLQLQSYSAYQWPLQVDLGSSTPDMKV